MTKDPTPGMVHLSPGMMEAFLKGRQERTPEEQMHDRRLEFRMDEFVVQFTPGPMGHPWDEPDPGGTILTVIQHPDKPHIIVPEDYGLSIRHYEPETRGDLTEHQWEESGHATTYPWHRVSFMEHRWWVDEEAFKKAEAGEKKPGGYL